MAPRWRPPRPRLLVGFCVRVAAQGLVDDATVTIMIAVIASSLVCTGLCILGFFFCKTHLEMQDEQRASLAQAEEEDPIGGVKEWYFMQESAVNGPFNLYQMLVRFNVGDVTRQTPVKLSWQDQFTPAAVLYPVLGTEFKQDVPPRMSVQDVHTDWHTYSILGQPVGDKPLPRTDWFYHADGVAHGPFETGKMRIWFLQGHFDLRTPVRVGDSDGEFVPIGEFFPEDGLAFATDIPSSGSHTRGVSVRGRVSQVSRQASQRGSIRLAGAGGPPESLGRSGRASGIINRQAPSMMGVPPYSFPAGALPAPPMPMSEPGTTYLEPTCMPHPTSLGGGGMQHLPSINGMPQSQMQQLQSMGAMPSNGHAAGLTSMGSQQVPKVYGMPSSQTEMMEPIASVGDLQQAARPSGEKREKSREKKEKKERSGSVDSEKKEKKHKKPAKKEKKEPKDAG